MADARTFYLDPSVIINQNAQQNAAGGQNVQNIQGDLQNAAGDTIFNTGELVADAAGVMPGDPGYVPTVGASDISNLGTLSNTAGDTVITINAPVENSVFEGAANRLNISNDTANGAVPLDTTGRKNYNVITLTEDSYTVLTAAGNVDPNTLYLIREMI